MATIRRFEDIEAWQKARALVKQIYLITAKSPLSKDYNLKDQMRRSATSVVLNIAEGFARKTNKEFSRFLVQAHGSIAELQSALYIANDLEYISREQFTELYNLAEEISKMTMSLSKYLLNNSKNSITL